jgi:hypothetical protein
MIRIYQPLLMALAFAGLIRWEHNGLICAAVALSALALIETIGIAAKSIIESVRR